jgi:hypothetical protein
VVAPWLSKICEHVLATPHRLLWFVGDLRMIMVLLIAELGAGPLAS